MSPDFALTNSLQIIDISKYPVHLYAKDCKGKYLEINDCLANDIGLDNPQDICGLSDFDLSFLSFNQATRLNENDMQILQQDKPQVFIENLTLFDKSKVTVLSHKMPLY